MRSYILIALLLATGPAYSTTFDLAISFDATQGDIYLPPELTGGQNYLSINRPLSSPLTLSQGDTLNVTFSSLNNFRFGANPISEFENATITWANYQDPFPYFIAAFHNLQFTGDLQKDFLPSSDWRPNYYTGGCPYDSLDFCKTDTFYKTGGLTDGSGATLDSAQVSFTLTDAQYPVNVARIAFEISSIASVPEASTWAMIILGFAGIGFVGYRRCDQPPASGALT